MSGGWYSDLEALYHEEECMYCGSHYGHSEWVKTFDYAYNSQGYELWFCCHACRDAGEPCETFHPIREDEL